ncbi:uncharacterized protein LOC110845722 isoform X2 [Folsomia candida]|uniref:uncharacterized protein LOC110845722 isoform X2 n=1 Tax=Folsomia candida TaxID=158441 RepID=UPI001604EF90|nr:uncharacterized protein LOC110845722 isoform X2 [Folsomia candida]
MMEEDDEIKVSGDHHDDDSDDDADKDGDNSDDEDEDSFSTYTNQFYASLASSSQSPVLLDTSHQTNNDVAVVDPSDNSSFNDDDERNDGSELNVPPAVLRNSDDVKFEKLRIKQNYKSNNHRRSQSNHRNPKTISSLGPAKTIQNPTFCIGRQVTNKDLQPNAAANKVSNRERIRLAQNEEMENQIIKKHLEGMKALIDQILKMQSSEEFTVQDEKHVGSFKALQSKFNEMSEQYKAFKNLKKKASTTLSESDYKKQMAREIYRLKGRLPAFAKRTEIDRHVDWFPESDWRVLIIQGQTGSGKSTQIPQYLADHPSFAGKRIICTQPRKIAAVSLAKRVSIEYSNDPWAKPGQDIGYQIGGAKVKESRVEFVTEGIMLERIMSNKPFTDVGCIIIDEAHERSIICDILLGSFKKADKRWKDILIVIMSATIDIEEFSTFFNNAPKVEMAGRTFPIEFFYHPLPDSATSEMSYIRREVVKKAVDIHSRCGSVISGDILCFLPGQEDVLSAKEDFEREMTKINGRDNCKYFATKVYSLFGRQDPEQQEEVFQKLGTNIRKIIFATDIAETSITIDGVVFVVDSGVRKEMIFDPKRNISTLKLTTISKSSATQRAGRSGRTQPGECHRLYSEADFQSMSSSSAPEVFRKPLSLAVLSLIEMNIVPMEFEWISSPSKDAMSAAEEELRYLGAIDEENKTTALGKLISKCQQEPKLVRMIYRGCQDGFGMAAVTIASIFTVANMFYYIGADEAGKQESRKSRNTFALESGDVVTMFRVFQEYLSVSGMNGDRKNDDDDNKREETEKVVNQRKQGGVWCRKNYINGKAIGLIMSTRKELVQLFRSTDIWNSQLNQTNEPTDNELRRIIFAGYFLHTARLIRSRKSKLPQYFAVHPSVTGSLDFKSALVHHTTTKNTQTPEWIVYEKILRLKTTLLPTSTPIDFSWIGEESPAFLALCHAKQDELPTEKIVISASQECLRNIFGRYFINLNSLEAELGCDLDVDIDNGILAAYCTAVKKPRVEANLKRKVQIFMQVLKDQVEEEDYLGGTRVVVGLGYEVQEILFPQDFITIFIRSLDPSVSKTELKWHLELHGISFRNLDLRSYETNQTAVIKFYSKADAKVALEVLKKEKFKGKELDVARAGMGPRRGVTQEEVCRLKLSWSLAPSEGRAQICFHTAAEANNFVETVSTRFGGARVTALHGHVESKNSKHQRNKPQPPAMVLRGIPDGACRYRFVVEEDLEPNEQQFDYRLTLGSLPLDIDEQELFRRVKPTIPKWARVNRTVSTATKEKYEITISDEELKDKLAPFEEYISDGQCPQFYSDKNLGRAILYVPVDNKLALQKASKIDYCSMKEDVYGQPHRLEIEYNHTTSVHTDLYKFIKDDIVQIKNMAYKKGAQVWDSADCNNKYGTKTTKSKFIFLKFRTCNPRLIGELQKSLESVSSYTKFNHESLHLLLTTTGKLELDRIGKTAFLYLNPRNNGLYIYGRPEIQEKTKKQLLSSIKYFTTLEVVDRPLMISKKKINLRRGKASAADVSKLERACKSSGVDYYDFVGNRILVSGSEKAFAKLKNILEKDGLLYEKSPSHLAKLKGRPDCTICLMPPDSDFIQSSICPHAFCIDCLQPMFNIMPPALPVKCQGEDCQKLLGIGDITKTAKKESLKKYLEVAVVKYQQEHSTLFLMCPKQDCGQILCASDKIIGERGGEFYFCDECVTTYCIPCSLKAEKPCKSHEYDTCEEARSGLSNEVQIHVRRIQEDILNLQCPRCKTAFYDFVGCVAVTCESCKCGFCGLCLTDCGNDAHAHARQCPKNPKKNEYYASQVVIDRVHRELKVQKLQEYLKDIEINGAEPRVIESIRRAIRQDLIDLEIPTF